MKFSSGICIITENVPKLARFYEKILQTEIDINNVHVELQLDGGSIIFYSKSTAEKEMGFDFTKYHGTGMVKISFFVDDVDAEYERLCALNMNVEFITLPTTYPWGARSMHFRDLDGNIVCFVCTQ